MDQPVCIAYNNILFGKEDQLFTVKCVCARALLEREFSKAEPFLPSNLSVNPVKNKPLSRAPSIKYYFPYLIFPLQD